MRKRVPESLVLDYSTQHTTDVFFDQSKAVAVSVEMREAAYNKYMYKQL